MQPLPKIDCCTQKCLLLLIPRGKVALIPSQRGPRRASFLRRYFKRVHLIKVILRHLNLGQRHLCLAHANRLVLDAYVPRFLLVLRSGTAWERDLDRPFSNKVPLVLDVGDWVVDTVVSLRYVHRLLHVFVSMVVVGPSLRLLVTLPSLKGGPTILTFLKDLALRDMQSLIL